MNPSARIRGKITILALLCSACGQSGGSATLGSEGGEVAGGGANVLIPAGALSGDTLVEVRAASSSLSAIPAGMELVGSAIAFTPHGTRFASPVRITLPHDGTATGAMRLDDESDTTWETVPTSSISGSEVALDVDGFSIYAAVRTMSTSDADAGTSLRGHGGGTEIPPERRDGGGGFGEVDGGGTVLVEDSGTSTGDADAGAATGDADGGPVVCNSVDPTDPSIPTGTASLTGAAFDAADVVALVTHHSGLPAEGIDFRTDVVIRFTPYSNACGLEELGTAVSGASFYNVRITETSETSQPGLPTAGTYDILNIDVGLDVADFTWADPSLTSPTCIDETNPIGSGTRPTGSLTLTSVTSSRIDGTFTYTNNSGATTSGSFSAPICGTTAPNREYCCQ